ncbi:MAG: PAS domain-containing protein [Planctomycetota bacterium]
MANEEVDLKVEVAQLRRQLEESGAAYSCLMENLPLCLIRKDSSGRFETANQLACREMGLMPEEVAGKTDFDLYPADLAKKYFADDQSVMQTGVPRHSVERHQSPAGAVKHVEVWKAPCLNAQGEAIGVQVMFWDITDQKDTEHQVEFERFLLSILLETVPDSVYFKDIDSRFIRLSRSCANKLGLADPREAIGKSDADFFDASHAKASLSDERRIIETGEMIQSKIEHEQYPDQEDTWCSTTKGPLRDQDGQIVGTYGISRDVSKRIKAETELAHERDLLKTIINNVPDLIYVKDSAGRFVLANNAVLELLGLDSQDQMIDKTDYDFSPPEIACHSVADDQQVIRTGQPLLDREESRTTEAGTTHWLLTTKVPLRNGDSEVIGLVGIGRDITERKKFEKDIVAAKEAADRANQAKSDFLANMSHEIRTPMNAIIGMTDLVLDTKLDTTQRGFLSMVQESGESLLSVINDILDFSKIEAGKLELDAQPFDLRECIGDTMKTLGLKAHAKALELAFRVAPSVPRFIVGDVGRLRQVLINLVGNAIKFTEVGEVFVQVDVQHPFDTELRLDFLVKDTGIGIPPERVDAIFREFEQVDSSVTRRFGGTGLGLAISSRLVHLMGGSLTVDSEPEKGSSFRFDLQMAAADESVEQDTNRGIVIVGGTRVLLVDDNATNRTILHEMLTNWGMVPIQAESAKEAIAILEESQRSDDPFKMVITDVHMPEMSGYQFIERLRSNESTKSIPIIVLTSGRRDDIQSLQRLSVSEHLLKPIKQSELFDAIVRTLGVNSVEDSGSAEEDMDSETIRGLRILLAEDNAINQKLAVGVLEKFGCIVVVVDNGEKAVQKVGSDKFDLVLMDVQMPVMDGLEATREIRRNEGDDSHVSIIAMTAHAMKGDREKCLEAGMDGYLAKPIRMDALRETLAGISANRSAEPSDSLQDEVADQPYSLDALRELVSDNDSLMNDLLSMYLQESEALLSTIDNAIETKDVETIRRTAHTLGGASRSVGATVVSRLADELRQATEPTPDETAFKILSSLRSRLSSVHQVIQSHLDKHL